MAGAADISRQLGMIPEVDEVRVKNLIKELHLPIQAEGCIVDTMYQDIFHDKKAINGKVNWVLMKAIGKVTVRSDIPKNVVCSAMASCL